MKKDFWKGFAVALVLVFFCSIAWKPLCGLVPWQVFPFQIPLNKNVKTEIIQGYLEKYYVDEYDEKKVEEMLFTGMVAGVGDVYTQYMPKENLDQYLENANGEFVGIGVEVYMTQTGETIVSSVMSGQPAAQAGIQEGDVIISVDGENMQGRMLSEVAAKIRGKKGTEVTVTVLRRTSGETLEFTMQRAVVVMESVDSRMLENQIGYISLRSFKDNTHPQFQQAMETLLENNMQGLILDLRDNPGGLVSSVYQIGEEILPEGTMVYTLDNRERRSDLKCDDEYLDIPLVMLVNGNSASASEILAGAVKDMGRGTLVGTQTFGKGLVQRLFPLPDGSGLNVTIQKYYTPKGTSIHGVGVVPDQLVSLPQAYAHTSVSAIPAQEDTQLQAAIEILREEMD